MLDMNKPCIISVWPAPGKPAQHNPCECSFCDSKPGPKVCPGHKVTRDGHVGIVTRIQWLTGMAIPDYQRALVEYESGPIVSQEGASRYFVQ